jgi:hypothetical protein
VRLGVVVPDVQEVCRLAKGRHGPVQVAHPVVDGRVAGADVADVALKVLDVDGLDGKVSCFYLFLLFFFLGGAG